MDTMKTLAAVPSFKKMCYRIMEDYQVASAWFIFDKSMLTVTHDLVLQDCHKENIIFYNYTVTDYSMMLWKSWD